MQKVCLDAGILSLIFTKKANPSIQKLYNKIKKKELECYVVSPVLVEVYWNICKTDGIEVAKISVSSFIHNVPHILVPVDEDIVISAGTLRCQHRSTLSYIDCMSIAFCLNNGITFHTTEKNLKKIPHNTLQRLKVVKYKF